MIQPPTAELLRRTGLALQHDDRTRFVAGVRALIAANAPLAAQWKSLAQPLLAFGEVTLATQAMARHARAAGYAAPALFDQALMLAQSGRISQAKATLAKVPRTIPDRASHAFLRGTLALNAGETDEAIVALEEAVAARPGSGQIWQTLSSVGSMAVHAKVGDRIIAAAPTMSAAPLSDRALFLYALGKTYHDRGTVDAAFRAFAEGASLLAGMRRHDRVRDASQAAESRSGWTAGSVATLSARSSVPTDRPIIVTGLPRSGSTLVEQILVSHSAVSGGEEVGSFAQVVHHVGAVDETSAARWAQSGSMDDLAALYLRLLSERFGSDGRVVDKTLDASRYLGLLAAVMPSAPIVWMRRDPLDAAWSCFRSYFARGVDWSWRQDDIAAHFRLEDQMFAFWQEVLGDRILPVAYEDLVRDKESVIPRILAHCALPMEPAVLTPERTARMVTTNSVAQVREPISTKAIDSAAPYADHLRPFLDAYAT